VKPAPIYRIRNDIRDCLALFQARAAEAGTPLTAAQKGNLQGLAASYHEALAKLAKKAPDQQFHAHHALLMRCDARVCALIRSLGMQKHAPWSYERLCAQAKRVGPDRHLTELVRAYWKVIGGKARLLVIFGVIRAASAIALRDVLIAMGCISKIDYAAYGNGGEGAFTRDVSKNMAGGYDYWVCLDVTNCYPSFRKEHLQELPIATKWGRIAFLGNEAKVKVSLDPGIKPLVCARLGISPVASLSSVLADSAAMVRKGLPLGSPLSPILAAFALGKAAEKAFAGTDVWYGAFVDNFAIGATTSAQAENVANQFSAILAEGPSPIAVHWTEVQHKHKVHLVGNVMTFGKGYDGDVHCAPGKPKTDRHREKCFDVIADAMAEGKNPVLELYAYWLAWFRSQPAWTRVPKKTRRASWRYAFGYYLQYLELYSPLSFLADNQVSLGPLGPVG
jgi:hypothetical protein